jgi:hypothetical protein
MHLFAGMMRTLIILLILSVVAAPITVRPDPSKPSTNDRVIVRVCTWPAQRPQRLTYASIVLLGARNDVRKALAFPSPGSRDHAAGSLTRARLSSLDLLVLQDTSSVHLSDCPRC